MKQANNTLAFRHLGACAVLLGGLFHASAWPGPQAALHVALVLGLAPEFRSPLVGVVWSALAGWLLEGSLRAYPQMGGTALANMAMTLVAHTMLIQWPPQHAKALWGRLAGLTLVHFLLVHLCVRLAAGPHAWGWSAGLWSLLTVPLWAGLAFRLHRPLHRR